MTRWAYHARGFYACKILDGGSFVQPKDGLLEMGITLNVASRNKHEPEAEMYIRTLNTRVRAIAKLAPF